MCVSPTLLALTKRVDFDSYSGIEKDILPPPNLRLIIEEIRTHLRLIIGGRAIFATDHFFYLLFGDIHIGGNFEVVLIKLPAVSERLTFFGGFFYLESYKTPQNATF